MRRVINILLMGRLAPELYLFTSRYFDNPLVSDYRIQDVGNTFKVAQIKGISLGYFLYESNTISPVNSFTTLLSSHEFDFTNTLIISLGRSDGFPKRVSLGDTIVSNSVIDLRSESDIVLTNSNVNYREYNRFLPINPALLEWIYASIKSVELVQYSSLIGNDISNTLKQLNLETKLWFGPIVSIDNYDFTMYFNDDLDDSINAIIKCTSMVDYTKFTYLTNDIQEVASWGYGKYLARQNNDSDLATVTRQFGLFKNFVSIRSITKFDRRIDGVINEDIENMLNGSFDIAMENNFRIIDKIINTIIIEREMRGTTIAW